MLILGLSTISRPALCRNVLRSAVHSRSAAFSTTPSVGRGLLANVRKQRFLLSTPVLLSRSVTTDAHAVTATSSQEAWKRFGITAAAVAGTIIVAEAFLNRDTRDSLTSSTLPGASLLTALTARSMFRAGLPFRMMAANPWAVLGVSLCTTTPPEKSVQKHLFWAAFNVCQGATLSPIFFFSPAILARAALYTCGVVGALSYVGATAKTEKYLYMGGPLLAGVTVVALSSVAPIALPLGLRGLAVAEALSIYGGLAVFSGFVLYDTQKILQHGRAVKMGLMTPDPIGEAISLELDMINIFIRMVQVLAMRSDRK
ncbi:Bax inhibitor family protein [Pisolithus microcarpus]|nr:Bax inhibitor family protein [Pisolithus microcarpus]